MVQSNGEKYHGSSDTRLEEALRGTMADKLTAEERDRVFEWIDAGATPNGYAKVESLFTQKCMPCHSAQSGLPIPSLASFEDVQRFTTTDTGESQPGTRLTYPYFGYRYHIPADGGDLQLECNAHLVSCVRCRRSLPGNCFGHRIVVGNQIS